MALRFWFGASGAGKTTAIQKEMIERAAKERHTDFLMIVPDQFTMHTQKQMVANHPDGGILNIDVLSFGRLSHRIFEEIGKPDRPLLDDTGKCLVLRKIMEGCKGDIPLLTAGLHNPGFVQEIKSVLSEFMQYNLMPEDVLKLSSYSEMQKSLSLKLKDLAFLYDVFRKECSEKYITSESTLHLLCERIPLSELIRRSVIVFDGFTGFTPIQNKVIEELLIYAKEVNVVLEMDHRYSPYTLGESTELFALTRQTVYSLHKLAKANNVSIGNDVIMNEIPVKRFAANPEMSHLERMLFRNQITPYKDTLSPSGIRIVKAATPDQECSLCCENIFELICNKGYRYRDIAIVTSDMASYENILRNRFEKYGIPYFIDTTDSLIKNPFVAYIRSALAIVRNNFRYDDVFTFLRSGFTGFDISLIDKTDNYVRARGINGYHMWSKPFLAPSKELRGKEEELEKLEHLREGMLEKLAGFIELAGKQDTSAGEWSKALYYFCKNEKVENQLKDFAQFFKDNHNPSKAKEYEQIYRLIMELLDQIVSLLGEEELKLKEFCEILDAGLMEIRVAGIPQGVDILMVGDIERTRLKDIKALFFLGVNEGKIPRDNRKGGLISDLEREFLIESGTQLAPTPAMQMFMQQLYLYMSLTKPEEYLWLSYATVSEDGNAMSPAYLLKTIRDIFPGLAISECETQRPILVLQDKKDVFSELLQAYLNEELDFYQDKKELFLALYRDLSAIEPAWVEYALKTSFASYSPGSLSSEIAHRLYGEILNCSISSLERFASCKYSYFLTYGLGLKERENCSFGALDMGNISHEILQLFGEELKESGVDWAGVQEEVLDCLLEKVTMQVLDSYENAFLDENDRNAFYFSQIKRILRRTVRTLQMHLRAGRFVPYEYEKKFSNLYDNSVLLKGKVDRIDIYETDDEIMVKIIDYKTGSRDFDITGLYYGLSLQLAIYMGQVAGDLAAINPDKKITPAAMLYYRMSDPHISRDCIMTEEELEEAVLSGLNYKGVVCSREGIVDSLDENLQDKSVVIPVKKDRKTMQVKENDHVMDSNTFAAVLQYAAGKALELAGEIKQGSTECNPIQAGEHESCAYCAFKSSCGFDGKIPGYQRRIKPEVTLEELLEKGGGRNEV